MSVSNPTSYIFNAEIIKVKDVVETTFKDDRFCGLFLKRKSDDYKFRHNDSLKDDYELVDHVAFNKCKSFVYYNKKGEAYPLGFSFHIHLDSLSETKTGVSIYPKYFEVYKGKSSLPVLPHFNRIAIFDEVTPTTVYEYLILFEIGKALNERNMPAIEYPDKITL